MSPRNQNNDAFTLIELLIVLAIFAILTSLLSGNLINLLKKGRDARRKTDLGQIQQALEMYYEDKKSYPTTISFGDKLCETETCEAGEKVYMQRLPIDPISSYDYLYQSDSSYYRLFSCIENSLDLGEGVSQTGFDSDPGCGDCTLCKYTIYSPNVTPLPAK